MNAMMSPTCIVPTATPWAPNQTIATVARFMTSVSAGIMRIMARFTKSCVCMRSRDTPSNFSSSWSSLPKARMLMTPSSISRATRFTRSTKDCIFLKRGIAST